MRGGRIWAVPQTLTVNQAAELGNDLGPAVAGPCRGTIHVQFTGDIPADPTAVGMLLLDTLKEATQKTWQLLPLGEPIWPVQVAPIRGRDGEWDGGFAIETTDADMTRTLAPTLNHLCLEGALGLRRRNVSTSQDFRQVAKKGRRPRR
jgi:hypothetical protein